MRRALILATLLAGCGGKSGTLTLTIVVSPVDDPFTDATTARITVGDSTHVKSFPVQGGHFNASIDLSPLKNPGPVIVEALDSGGNVIAHGQTPVVQLQPQNQQVAVWVGRPGVIRAAAAALPKPLAEFAATSVAGLGIVYAGGRSTDGTPLKDAQLYDILTHEMIPPISAADSSGIPPMQSARAGGVAAPTATSNAVVIGGSNTAGFGSASGALGNAESFSPFGGFGTWSSIPSDAVPNRAYGNLTLLGSANALITGGYDESGNVLDSGVLLTTSGTVRISALSTPMAAARVGHAVAAAKFPDGSDGAILIGGLPAGSTGPVAERLVGQSFSSYDVPGLENRIGATATTLGSGAVLVVGGTVSGVAVASGLVIDPSTSPPTVTSISGALSAPRVDHSATLVGADVLVCGGGDETGKLVASCDLIDGASYGLKSTMPLGGNGRRGHSALALETGPVVIAGGFGSDGAPLASIEIYTP